MKHHGLPIRGPARIPELPSHAGRSLRSLDAAGWSSTDIHDLRRRDPSGRPLLAGSVSHDLPFASLPVHGHDLHFAPVSFGSDDLEVVFERRLVVNDSGAIG